MVLLLGAICLMNVRSAMAATVCNGDFETDGEVDNADLAVFAANFGKINCCRDCPGDFEPDGSVDGSDLALFAADFGRTDCPVPETIDIGSEGGTLQLGSFEVVIPPGFLPYNITLAVTELPSQAYEVSQQLDPARYHPISLAYKFSVPFLSNEPLTLSLAYQDNEIPEGFEAQNLAVLVRIVGYPEYFDSECPEEIIRFVPLPAQVNQTDRIVQTEIYGSGTFQIVALDAPLPQESTVATSPSITNSSATEHVLAEATQTLDHFRVLFMEAPSSWTLEDRNQFQSQILEGLNAAYDKLVVEKGFTAPTATVWVYAKIDSESENLAHTFASDPLRIMVDPSKWEKDPNTGVFYGGELSLRNTMVHEYFHLIQNWNSNFGQIAANLQTRIHLKNRWFVEGTAEWATDEVYDTTTPNYHAPTGERFRDPVNTSSGGTYPYETVVFWKWLEERSPGSILAIIEDHNNKTHSHVSASIRIANNVPATYLESLMAVHPDLNFVQFAMEALYWKNFDVDETGEYDLWGSDKLGPPENVPQSFRNFDKLVLLQEGGDGDGIQNKKTVGFSVRKYLAVDHYIIKNEETGQLCGTLVIEFEKPPHPDSEEVQATVFDLDTHEEKRIPDLSTTYIKTMPFCGNSEVLVLILDPRWLDEYETYASWGKINVWVQDIIVDIQQRSDSVTGYGEVGCYNCPEPHYQGSKECLSTQGSYNAPSGSFSTVGCLTIENGVWDDQTVWTEIPPFLFGVFSDTATASISRGDVSASGSSSSTTSLRLIENGVVFDGTLASQANQNSAQAVALGSAILKFTVPPQHSQGVQYEVTWDCNLTSVRMWYPGGNYLVYWNHGNSCEPVSGLLPPEDYWIEVESDIATQGNPSVSRGGSFQLILTTP
jgi:hypothetical protein